jgi:hypothetical protein
VNLNNTQIAAFRKSRFLRVPNLFEPAQMQATANNLSFWQRAVAFHSAAEGATFAEPAWKFDEGLVERVSRSGAR